MKDYLDKKIADFKKYYNVQHHLSTYCNNDCDLNRRWKKDFNQIQNQWQDISSISKMQEYVDMYSSIVERCNDAKGIFIESYDMNLALYRAIKAIEKVANCYDRDGFDFNEFGQDEIDKLFAKLYYWTKEMQNISFRRSVQD